MFFVGFFFGVLVIIVLLIVWQATYPDGTPADKEPILGQVFSRKKTEKKKKPKYVSEEDQWKKEQNQPPSDPGEING